MDNFGENRDFDDNIKRIYKNVTSIKTKHVFLCTCIVTSPHLYIIYELNDWSRNPTNNFPLQIWLFGTVSSTYNAWGIAFDGEPSQGFCNDFARNIIIFGFDNNSS